MIKEAVKSYSQLIREFNLLVDEPLKNYTSFKIGGTADLLALPKNRLELQNLIKSAYQFKLPVTLIGGGTNILISDRGVRGLVIITKQLTSKIRLLNRGHNTTDNTKTVIVDAGERLSKVCQFAINHNLSGLEFAAGIPGTVGGAIIMNAGTKSGDISTIIDSIDVLDRETFKIETVKKEHLNFTYRHLKLSNIIVSAALILKQGEQKKIEQIFQYNLAKKGANQPLSLASAGCFFKNPLMGKSAGELIEKAGLKGVRVNDAAVSEKHGNFIVNMGNASCEDVILLKQKIQKTVLEKFNVQLKPEVRIEGE